MSQEYQPAPHPYQEWKVLSVRSGKTVPNKRGGGTLTALYVDFEGVDDGWCNSDGAYWNRKTGNEPSVGDTFWGELSLGEYGYRFAWDNTKETTSQGSQGPPKPDFKAAAGPAPTGETQDARQRSIARQSAQRRANEHLVMAGVKLPLNDQNGALSPHEQFASLVDWFQADANGEARPSAPSGAPSDLDVPFRTPIYPDPFSGPEKGAHGR